jgi:hypothetical protein
VLVSGDKLYAVMSSKSKKKRRNNFKFVKMIGVGGFSKVYEGTFIISQRQIDWTALCNESSE